MSDLEVLIMMANDLCVDKNIDFRYQKVERLLSYAFEFRKGEKFYVLFIPYDDLNNKPSETHKNDILDAISKFE